jgi:hypothetical protein
MTPSRSRVRIDRIDLDLVYYTLHISMGKPVRERQPDMCGDDEFSDGRESPILRAIEIGDGRAHTTERGIPLSVLRRASGQQT